MQGEVQERRRRAALYVCAALAVFALLLVLAGRGPEGWTFLTDVVGIAPEGFSTDVEKVHVTIP